MKRQKNTLVSTLMPIIFIGVMGLLLVSRPDQFQQLVARIVAAGFALFMVAIAVAGLVMLLPALRQRLGGKVGPDSRTPFVGTRGVGTGLRIKDPLNGPMRVEWSRRNYAFFYAIALFLGPGLLALQLWSPNLLNVRSWSLPGVLFLIAELGACAGLAGGVHYYAFKRHAMLIGSGEIVMQAGHFVAGRFARDELVSVRVETEVYAYDDESTSRNHDNFVLVVRLATGADERFCISDRRAQIEQIAAAIHTRMGVQVA